MFSALVPLVFTIAKAENRHLLLDVTLGRGALFDMGLSAFTVGTVLAWPAPRELPLPLFLFNPSVFISLSGRIKRRVLYILMVMFRGSVS